MAAAKPFSQTTRRQPDRHGTFAAHQDANKLRRRCQFCGLKQQARSKCPAKKDTCHKCSKAGHWASVCSSTAAVLQQSSDDEHETAAVLCSTGLPPANLNVIINFPGSNEQVQVMIDPGPRALLSPPQQLPNIVRRSYRSEAGCQIWSV